MGWSITDEVNTVKMIVFEDPTDIDKGSIVVIDPTVRSYHISVRNAFPTPQAQARKTAPKAKPTTSQDNDIQTPILPKILTPLQHPRHQTFSPPPSDPNTILIYAINHLPNPSQPIPKPPGTSSSRTPPQSPLPKRIIISPNPQHHLHNPHPPNPPPAAPLPNRHLRDQRPPLPPSHHTPRQRHNTSRLTPISSTPSSEISNPRPAGPKPDVTGTIAIKGLQHNNNNSGLGHGSSSPAGGKEEVLIARAAAGELVHARPLGAGRRREAGSRGVYGG
jgi:hypothetical protein